MCPDSLSTGFLLPQEDVKTKGGLRTDMVQQSLQSVTVMKGHAALVPSTCPFGELTARELQRKIYICIGAINPMYKTNYGPGTRVHLPF